VNEETKKKIQEVADALKYYPNAIARSLVKKGSHTFGYIVSGLERGTKHNIIQEFLTAIYDFTRKCGYEVLVMTVDSESQSTKSYLQFAREHNLAGIIVSGIRTDDVYYKEMLNSQIPCVLIDLVADNIRVGCVTTDNYEASREAVAYLNKLGHKNIAFLNGKEFAAVSVARYSGYQAEMRKRGLNLSLDLVLNGEFSEEIAYQETKKFLPLHPEVTAIFCASDLMAIGAMRAAQDLGINVPKQLSIVGFDNIPVASYTSPALTTIEQDFYQMGYEAAQMLYSIVHGKDIPHSKKISHKFIERSSAAMV
ncbi:MAG: LacI family transcriptional regulator, partial [Clostridia bacterium]|nr:LacI family transcriptional regulator [Clostridia bacterium]